LITSQSWDTLDIIPSRSDIEYLPEVDRYVATGCVVNTSKNFGKCLIIGRFEIVNNCDIVPLTSEHKSNLARTLQKAPLSREVLMTKSTFLSQSTENISPICNFISEDHSDCKISDADFADALLETDPSYFGEAKIDPEIIEPNGLDLPTIIYKDAAEAIDLSQYSEEIRKYIKDIFIDK